MLKISIYQCLFDITKFLWLRYLTQFYSSYASGLGNGVDTQSKVPGEQQQKVFGTNEGAGVRPKVPIVPQYDSESDEESWTFSQDEEYSDLETYLNDDSEETKSNNDGDDLTYPNLVSTPPEYELTEEEENKEGDDRDINGEQVQDKGDDLYRDVNINMERSDAELIDAQANQDTEDYHMTLTHMPPVVQQQTSSVSSDSVSKFINPYSDTFIDSLLNPNIQSHTFVNVLVFVAAETSSSDTKIPQPLIPNIQPLQQTPGIVDNYLASKMKEAVYVAVELQTNKLREEAQAENQELLNQVDSTMKTIIKEQVQAQVSKIMPKIKKYVTKSLGVEVLILIDKIEENKSVNRSDIQKNLYNALVELYNSDKDIITSYGDVVTLKRDRDDQDKDEDPFVRSNRGSKRRRSGKSAHAEEHDQMDDDLEDQPHLEFNTRNNDDECQWTPSSFSTPNRE
nr:hypothetical protein [Tanacetum cinerariifolium]